MLFDEEVKKKLEDGEIKFETVFENWYTPEGDPILKEREHALFPCGRDYIKLRYSDQISREIYLSSSIEKYKFIRDLGAIWSPELGVIECSLESTRLLSPPNAIFHKLHRIFDSKENDENRFQRFNFDSSENGVILSIGGATTDFLILSLLKGTLFRFDLNRKKPTLRIENLQINKHDEAKNILKRLGNSILFKLDITFGLGVKLAEDKIRNRFPSRIDNTEVEFDKTFPKYEYDSEPMSLYWYAKSATDMPLLQFLAFYQILEFYYPVYSQREAHQKIKNIIKDPRFNPNKDSDISTIINSIKQNKNQLGFGSELEQLKATLTNCIGNEELKEFIESNDGINNYYNDKDSKKLSSKHVNFNNVSSMIIDFAERLYEIRCRIVHTKVSEKDYKLLIPSSPELKFMIYEIAILEQIVKKVLISSSREINL